MQLSSTRSSTRIATIAWVAGNSRGVRDLQAGAEIEEAAGRASKQVAVRLSVQIITSQTAYRAQRTMRHILQLDHWADRSEYGDGASSLDTSRLDDPA